MQPSPANQVSNISDERQKQQQPQQQQHRRVSSTLATCCSHLCVKFCGVSTRPVPPPPPVPLFALRSVFPTFFALCLHSFAASLTTFVVAAALFATCLLLCFCYCATHSEADESEDEGRRCCLSVFAASLLLSWLLATCCVDSDATSLLLPVLLLLFLLIIGFNEFHNCFAFGLLMISSSSSTSRLVASPRCS